VDERRVAAVRGELAQLPLSVVLKIDQLADEFESEWQLGKNPDINSYVRQVEAAGDLAKTTLESHLRELQTELSSAKLSLGQTPANTSNLTSAAIAADALPLQIPDEGEPITLGEYRLLGKLGSGGMGVVYKALHTKLDCLVAMKFPRFSEVLDSQAAARFLRESRLIARLKHANIVRAFDAGESPYGPFLVTEFVAGETVEALVQREGPLPFDECISLTMQAVKGLGYAHSQGVIHRDIKPSNLLIDGAGLLQVVDFGLAKTYKGNLLGRDNSQAAEQTVRGIFLGTVGYAAPEQLIPDEPVDQRADIYALGCVMYFLLTGKPAHEGSLSDRLLAKQNTADSVPQLPLGQTSPGFGKLWRRMVAEVPDDRQISMSEVEQELETELVAWEQGKRSSAPARHSYWALPLVLATVALITWGVVRLQREQKPNIAKLKGPVPVRAEAPFGAKQGQQFQQQWADYLDLPVRVENSIGMRLVLIPAGEFEMGLSGTPQPAPLPPPGDWRYLEPELIKQEQLPRHRVVLTKAYYFGETEVTYNQFRQFAEASGYVTDVERTKGWGKEDRGWLRRTGYSWKSAGQWIIEDQHPVSNVTWNNAVALCNWLSKHDAGLKLATALEPQASV
jgi:serine/threonine protein kinase